MSEHLDTKLILAAWGMALTQGQPPAGLVFHSDRSVQYASQDSTRQMGRFETEVLTQSGNLTELTKLSGKWIDRLRERQPVRELILDMESSVSETYGEQEVCGKAQLATNRHLCQRKTEGGLDKSPCKSVEQAENREKAAR